MPQIALDIDAAVLVQTAATQRHLSSAILGEDNLNEYQKRILALFGAIKDDTFVEPPEIDACYDLPREEF